jgi:hypothetical protein
MIPTGVFTFSVHLEPSAALGSNSQISLVEATLMLNPPRMYSLLLAGSSDWLGAFFHIAQSVLNLPVAPAVLFVE